MPRCSIIMTLYNREDFVAEAIQSVIDQTEDDWQLIIRDDGSTDRSFEIARAFADHDPRITAYPGEHVGTTRAAADAYTHATAAYLGQVDSDDRIDLETLRKTCDHLDAHPDIGMVYTQHRYLSSDGELGEIGPSCLKPYSPRQLLTDFMTFHFRLMRRDAFDQAGGLNTELPYAHDYDLCLRLSEVTEIGHIPEPLYHYRVGGDSISTDKRFEQIECAQRAVEDALQRRGMTDQYELSVRLRSTFRLLPRR